MSDSEEKAKYRELEWSFMQPHRVCRRSPFSSHNLQQRLECWSLKCKSLSKVRYHQRLILWDNFHNMGQQVTF